jgi:hypothetical protein
MEENEEQKTTVIEKKITKTDLVSLGYGIYPLPIEGGRRHAGDTYCDEEKKGGPW